MAGLRKINPYEVFSYIYGEPKSSPVPNLDYEFATARYSNSNFRRAFVDKFIRYIAADSEIEIYNCRFEKPRNEINLINFYIYKKLDEDEKPGRIKDPDNYYITSFYEVLKQSPTGGLTPETKMNFYIRDIELILQSNVIDKSIRHINEVLLSGYPFEECYGATYWDKIPYIFIKGKYYDAVLEDFDKIADIKAYCFQIVKAYDKDKIFTMDSFKICIESYDIYRDLGGYGYFNSDRMKECPMY